MERMPSSQHANGDGNDGNEFGKRQPLARLVKGFSYFKQILQENLFGWQSSNAADGARDNRNVRVDPERAEEGDVPIYQVAKVQDQELIEGSDERKSDDFVVGGISGINPASEARRSSQLAEEVSMVRSHGQTRDDVVFTLDSTYKSLREWPLLGFNHGMEDRRAAIHDQDSMQRSHGQRSDCDAVANANNAGGSRQSEWPQQFQHLREEGKKKEEAKRKRKERRRRSSRKQ